MAKKKAPWLGLAVALMFVVDQAIKLVIWNGYYDADVVIIKGFLRFAPLQNTRLSWFGSLGIPFFDKLWFNLLFSAVAFYLIVMGYLYATKKLGVRSRYANTAFVCILSGALCSIVDTIFWGGSIDYIALFNWFTFDLKDCYIAAFEVLLILGLFLFYKRFEEISVRRFLRFAFRWK